MILQISSGMGPVECRAAVGGIYKALEREFSDIEMITSVKGEVEGAFSSIIFSSERDLSEFEGTMQWTCKSKYRPGHKRKNWFVDVSIIPEVEEISEKLTTDVIRIEKFHSGGPGGQNVNKVETGVRIIHLPTGITVSSTRERSQFANKQDALKKLSTVLKEMNVTSKDRQKNDAWSKHAQIVRGNPIRIYEGEEFNLTFAKEKEEKDTL
ncbi:peptide chain release factor H [Butyrivibrio sp. INlla16]|uniref:peptide chain release factor H n=1 Tax=Butyrivibrio sp. INlla16 TaxID=1520807 RepID=UPI00088723F7|nr:peptide chain release factor H [Butyrivibrio sp. INlla16]SDB13939.1 peptide chain release factor [Butyrivibrio sp. INlla16]